jgi:ATP-binding cassette subfamily B (MDR/TAP) protein 1
MLLGFLKPDDGFIRIDGHVIDEYNVHFLRENIALVDQEPDIFNMSIRQNIAYANQDIPNSLPDVMAAAAVTNSSEFIDTANEKYENIVGNDKLSGGQKQRLALARAYYKKASIVIMDEPTSALDRHSSKIFVESLDQYYGGKTVILITHDLSLLSKIPNIFIVENKQIQPIEQFGGLEAYKSRLQL